MNTGGRIFLTYAQQLYCGKFFTDDQIKEAETLINKTEFSLEELKIIENTFEKNTNIFYTKDDCKESVKEVFTDKAELIPI